MFSGIIITARGGFAILHILQEKLIDLVSAQVLFQLSFSFLKRFCGQVSFGCLVLFVPNSTIGLAHSLAQLSGHT